jgi:hypothetical protein
MLQATWNGVEYRLDIFHATKGAHIEIYRESCIFFCLVAPTLGSLLPLLEHRADKFPQFLDHGQSIGLLGRVISSLQEKVTYSEKKL